MPPSPAEPPARESYLTGDAGAAAGRVAFVSRSAADATDEPRLPTLRDPWLLGVLALVLVLQALSWSLLEGYQLADSVEYMERAHAFTGGVEMNNPGAVRSFGFSALLVPFFALAEWSGLEDVRGLVWVVRLFQMALGLALVRQCARLGARVAGRRAGLAAAFLVGTNPIFLQYSVSPVSGVAAALFVALALERLFEPGSTRRALVGGLWLGAAFLMAYQTILVAVPLLFLMLLRDRLRGFRRLAGALVGLAIAVGIQVALDRVTYGSWGVSLSNYVLANAGAVVTRWLAELGQRDLALKLYNHLMEMQGHSVSAGGEARQLQGVWFYFTHIDDMVVWPAVGLFALGLLVAYKRASWRTTILVFVLAANVLVMSSKGAKSFRLWLPLLPMLGPLCALGWVALVGRAERPGRVRAALGGLLLAACLALGLRNLLGLETRRFGPYWRAVAWVNETVEREAAADARADADPGAEGDAPQDARPLLVSAYHWAVFLRMSPRVAFTKLPQHLDRWTNDALTPEQRAECLDALRRADFLLAHQPILEQERGLFEAISERFEVAAAFWDENAGEDLGPVLVLRARGEGREPRLLLDVAPLDEAPDAYRERLQLDRRLPHAQDFVRVHEDGGVEHLVFLGWRYRALPGDHLGWIEYHWTSAGGLREPYTVTDRLTAPDGKHAWQNDHQPGWGFLPFPEWRAGTVVREGYPVLAGEEPFTPDFVALGGPYRRGELIPASLWLKVVRFEGADEAAPAEDAETEPAELEHLWPARPGERAPMDLAQETELPGGRVRTRDGYLFSPDRLVRVGRAFLPVHPLARWPDDGRPDPD